MTNVIKRQFMRRVAGGLAGLEFGLAAPSGAAQVTGAGPLRYWAHGHVLDIGLPDSIESATSAGAAKILRGRSFSRNCLHFGLSLPGAAPGVVAVLLRYRAEPGALVRVLRLFDGERELAVLDAPPPSRDWSDQRIVLPAITRIERGLGLTLEIEFGAVEREIAISAVGAEYILMRGDI